MLALFEEFLREKLPLSAAFEMKNGFLLMFF